MLTSLLSILLAALGLFVIYLALGMFITGQPLRIVGLILGIILLLYAFKTFDIALQ